MFYKLSTIMIEENNKNIALGDRSIGNRLCQKAKNDYNQSKSFTFH